MSLLACIPSPSFVGHAAGHNWVWIFKIDFGRPICRSHFLLQTFNIVKQKMGLGELYLVAQGEAAKMGIRRSLVANEPPSGRDSRILNPAENCISNAGHGKA